MSYTPYMPFKEGDLVVFTEDYVEYMEQICGENFTRHYSQYPMVVTKTLNIRVFVDCDGDGELRSFAKSNLKLFKGKLPQFSLKEISSIF